ncbi:MAG: AAA family ATPase [Wenzhouxiangella sp.]|nr:AAA family ATPase [Wenzhouxiangella sp.]
MYESFYGLDERPFSITPNPRFVYLSQRHQDALAHLLFGVGRGGSGGFVQLTGEVGTGKTTLCRLLLEQVPDKTRVALILNPMLNPPELLRAICVELEVSVRGAGQSLQKLQERLNRFLLERHADGERVVLIIDEAQNMSRECLEQVRLLTNLETATDKLLQIILLGQPELRLLLARPELRQLAQRITARYHLDPLNQEETEQFVRHRLAVAGAPRCPFSGDALKALYRASDGVPRLINIIADRALMAGYAHELERIDRHTVNAAAREVAGDDWDEGTGWLRSALAASVVTVVLLGGGLLGWTMLQTETSADEVSRPVWTSVLDQAFADQAYAEMASNWPGLSASEIAAACNGEPPGPVACLRKRGSWGFIEQIGLPVILRLVEPERAHVLLTGIEGSHLVLRHQGQEYRAPLHQIDRRWLGEFLVAWPDDGSILRRGDVGPAVERMKALAEKVEEPIWTEARDDRYDESFQRWVTEFQRHHGLTADGMIGPETRLFLKVPHIGGPGLAINQDGV